jgi:hypothetical protein
MNSSIAKTFTQYVATVEQEFKASGSQLGEDITLYRGLSCACHSLVPSIARLRERSRDPGKEFSRLETEILEDFKKRSLHLLKLVPRSDLEWLTLAQHHGLPTRLLDWSSNALAALWFTDAKSIHEQPCRCEPQKKADQKYGAVWIFTTPKDAWITPDEEQNVLGLDELRIYMPKNVASRVTTQLGFFTIHPYENGNFHPLDESNEGKLKRILIRRKDFPAFRESLDHMGINRFAIFPDLDGLARHVRWYHFLEDDEAGDSQPS